MSTVSHTLKEQEKRRREELDGPLFVIAHGVLRYYMNGIWRDVPLDGVAFRKHGQYVLEYAGEIYGIVQHTTVNRIRRRVVMIPPNKTAWISDGEFRFVTMDYRSFTNHDACPRCLATGTEKFRCEGWGPPQAMLPEPRHDPLVFCMECCYKDFGVVISCPSCWREAGDCEVVGEPHPPQAQEA